MSSGSEISEQAYDHFSAAVVYCGGGDMTYDKERAPMDMSKRIRVQCVETLSDDWYILKKTTFDFQRADSTWQTISRETYDRGNGATLLLYNQERQTVVLTRQFRYPAYVNGHHGLLIE